MSEEPTGLSRRDLLAVSGALAAGTAVEWSAARRPRRRPTSQLPNARRIAARGDDPADLEAVECAALLQARILSSAELLGACVRRVERRDGPINAWVRTYAGDARAAAAAADKRLSRREVRRRGRHAPLVTGIPVGLKDLYAVAGKPLTASSRL